MVLFEIYQKCKGHFFNELRVSFKVIEAFPSKGYTIMKKQAKKGYQKLLQSYKAYFKSKTEIHMVLGLQPY